MIKWLLSVGIEGIPSAIWPSNILMSFPDPPERGTVTAMPVLEAPSRSSRRSFSSISSARIRGSTHIRMVFSMLPRPRVSMISLEAVPRPWNWY